MPDKYKDDRAAQNKRAKRTTNATWPTVQKIAKRLAEGETPARAYAEVRGVAPRTAANHAARFAQRPDVVKAVAHFRKQLLDSAAVEFVLEHQDLVKMHTINVLTPIKFVDEDSPLAQEVITTTTRNKDGSVSTKKTIKTMPKMESMKEIAKLGGYYAPEKVDFTATNSLNDSIAALSENPLFAEMLADEARVQGARIARGAVIEIESQQDSTTTGGGDPSDEPLPVVSPPVPAYVQKDLGEIDTLTEEDEEYLNLIE